MKAIDILKNHIRDLEKMVLVFDEYAMYKSRDETNKAIQELTEAIAELEALENRSCSNCKFEDYQAHLKPIKICGKDKSFCCNKWESK